MRIQSTKMILVMIAAFSLLFSGLVSSDKVCTNSGVQSHTARYQLFTSNNYSSWDRNNFVDLNLITNDDDRAWSNSIPRKALMEEDGLLKLNTQVNRHGGTSGVRAGFLKEVSLHDVRLSSFSIQAVAQQTNLEYLLMLDVDRLVWSFRKTVGMETPGEPYGGWEAPNIELRGHFVGHYLSASALMRASTHNTDVKTKMSKVVSALSECQNKLGTGYLSAFPLEFFDRFEALQEVWAPYYTIHKILAGLLDQYTLAGNGRALNMTAWMVDYFYNRVQTVISNHTIERHWLSLNEETGGMNDVLYKLYTITRDEKHLLLAHLFDKPCFLGLLAMKADDISGFHANTHIPIVVGAQQRYEVTGDPIYKEIGEFFMDIVNSSHSYATGGTSVSEFWYDPKRLAGTLRTENQESCTTYNMLKVSRHLFRWTKDISYADYYERALTNGVLGIQRGRDPGVMIYMLPLRPGGSKARSYHGWGTKFNSFWCCYGTGIESFSKLGDSIYFEEEGDIPGVYIIQYVSSSLDWKSGKILLTQKVRPAVSWDQRLRVTLSISSRKQVKRKKSTLNFRIPYWALSNGSNASLNDRTLPMPLPGNFLSITRSWKPGQDAIDLELHMSLRTEPIKDDRMEYASILSFLYGPYLLAGLSIGDWAIKINPNSLSDSITSIPAYYNHNLITLSQEFNDSAYVLMNSDSLIKMECTPEHGTDAAIRATFRLIEKNSDPINKLVMLEPFDYPGTLVHHLGKGESLEVANASSVADEFSVFCLVPGLNGKEGTVSLQSESRKGCYVYSNVVNGLETDVKLGCCSDEPDAGFAEAASFIRDNGIYKYGPMSFVAKGVKRNFVMMPLYSLRDESYTVYFNSSS